ncbi:uncharacterized protein CEXT_616941 [Caerostris extrusa]|uniref:Uncharacterized protein n=1 Tax=Caerostris extrusa TaxID=172846 RepID=A0AAV4RPJ1_CAEEX|nr:uncharacterized protein CEXT_616941 [Caerostris extrusa]
MPRSPPMKRRKVSDSLLLGSNLMDQSFENGNLSKALNNFEILPHRCRSQNSKVLPIPMHMSRSIKGNDLMPSSIIDEVSPSTMKIALSPGNKPFYSPIFPAGEKCFDLPTAFKINEKTSANQPVVPTVLFTPSSPTLPSTDNENVFSTSSTSISETTKSFLLRQDPHLCL